MNSTLPAGNGLHHHRRRMLGRDPDEVHRAATPLELLFDLTFATSFSFAAAQLAHALAAGHVGAGLIGFGFASFAICWAWINFSWFASAFDTDDWIFRLMTMVQMIGVLIVAIGLPRLFASIEHGHHLDNSVMVLGYVVMRLAMVGQWLRAARSDPIYRQACLCYVVAILVAQIGWVAQIFIDLPLWPTLAITTTLMVIELAGPVVAETRYGGTPWHVDHIVERYGCFAIIALGEGVVGTVAAISAVIEANGWTSDIALVSLAGMGLTFGLWWVYYMLPSAKALRANRGYSLVWGYAQMLVVAAIVATGAGLHVAANYIEHEAQLDAFGTVLTVAIPVSVFLAAIYGLYAYLLKVYDRFHMALLLVTALVIACALIAAAAGLPMAACLVIVMLAPVVTVVGYETIGHRHKADRLARLS